MDSLLKSTDELKKLIAEHPDYKICVIAGENASGSDYYYTYCSDIRYELGEILDTDYYDYDDAIFVDRDRLKETVEDRLCEEYEDDEELEAAVAKKLEELEPFWTPVICIYADN